MKSSDSPVAVAKYDTAGLGACGFVFERVHAVQNLGVCRYVAAFPWCIGALVFEALQFLKDGGVPFVPRRMFLGFAK